MRPAPALSIATGVAPAWRIAVLSLCLAAALVTGLWLWQWPAMRHPGTGWLLGLAVAAVVLAAASSAGRRPLQLRWDGREWHLVHHGREQPGTLAVCLDLGAGWLLRFQPAGTVAPWHALWLPVSAGALGGRAHALRCALYSPRFPAGIPGQPPAPDV